MGFLEKMKSRTNSRFGIVFAYCCLLFISSGYFLRPASWAVLDTHSPASLLSAGDDALTVPFQESTLLKLWKRKPSQLLYGSVYTDSVQSPEGFGLWIPWVERILVVTLSFGIPEDRIPSAMVWCLILLNGFSFSLMGRALRWSPLVWIPLGLAFALTPYVRARAMAHHVLAGVYSFPLVIAALEILARKHLTVWKPAAVIQYLGVATATYFIVGFFNATRATRKAAS